MYTIRANSNRIAYGVKRYTLDTIDDLKKLNISTAFPGSSAFIVETSTRYVLNNKKQWIKTTSNTGGGEGGGSSGDEDYDGGSIDGTDPIVPEDVPEYDGGSIDGTDPIVPGDDLENNSGQDGGSIDGSDPIIN